MNILDKHFIALPKDKKAFIITIGTAWFLLGVLGVIIGAMNLIEGFLFVVIGMLYAELLKLKYRIENLEK